MRQIVKPPFPLNSIIIRSLLKNTTAATMSAHFKWKGTKCRDRTAISPATTNDEILIFYFRLPLYNLLLSPSFILLWKISALQPWTSHYLLAANFNHFHHCARGNAVGYDCSLVCGAYNTSFVFKPMISVNIWSSLKGVPDLDLNRTTQLLFRPIFPYVHEQRKLLTSQPK